MWKWDPFDEMQSIQEQMNRMFVNFWSPVGPRRMLGTGRGELVPHREFALSPFVDVRDADDSVVVTADMPGVLKDDISISVTDDALELSAERKEDAAEDREQDGFVRRERYYSRFHRTVPLPAPVDDAGAKATLNNGVLEVTLPKSKVTKRKRKIDVN